MNHALISPSIHYDFLLNSSTTTMVLCFYAGSSRAEEEGCVFSSSAGPDLHSCLPAQGLRWPCRVTPLWHLVLPNSKISNSTHPPP